MASRLPGLARLALLCVLAGCAATSNGLEPSLRTAIGTSDTAKGARKALIVGIEHLYAGDLEAASRAFNRGLEIEPRDPHLNFLNGYVYELRAEASGPGMLDLAEIGYRLALREDPGHWLAAWRLGLLAARRQRLPEARDAFARALSVNPGHGPSAYGLAAVSYELGDLPTAAAALAEVPPAERQAPLVLRANAIVQAALGHDAEAERALEAYRRTAPERAAHKVERRMRDWQRWRAQSKTPSGGALAEQMAAPTATPGEMTSDMPDSALPMSNEAPAPAAPAPAETPAVTVSTTTDTAPEPSPRMVLLDVVLLQQETSTASAHGINLLAALQVQLGATLIDATRNQSVDGRTGAITRHESSARDAWSISVPSVTYALNIANAQNTNSEVVSRPSVLAYDGEESEVFIGSELTYVAGGVNSGRSYNKEVGVSLTARPQFLGDGRLKLEVRTEFTNFIPSSAPGSFEESVATTKSRTRVSAELALGQTLALAAGRTHRDTHSRGGVPILRDIPILQYFFSTSERSRSDGALLILLTPRRALLSDGNQAPRHLTDAVAKSGDPAANAALDALRARNAHWFNPTSTALAAMHLLESSDTALEFRRGDLQFGGIEAIEAEKIPAPRYRQVLDDLVELLYF
ncbi:MAG: tetratricopeptide repeat protein [Myxococcales bacterium]|nr:tetratricopeptide repeat protein [Myxococcales bacterium]